MTTLSIGQVAKRTGLGIDTLRYYEREKLIPPPQRGHSGYRRYTAEIVERISFIQRAKTLGFTLSEISELLNLRSNPERGAAEVKQKALAKIEDIENKIKHLEEMRKELIALAKSCRGNGGGDGCAILAGIESKPLAGKN